MAHATPEEIQKHVKVYFVVFGALLVLTIATVAASYLDIPFMQAVILALAIATLKGFLVAAYFMHLVSETKIIRYILILTAIFLVALFALPIFTDQGGLVAHVS